MYNDHVRRLSRQALSWGTPFYIVMRFRRPCPTSGWSKVNGAMSIYSLSFPSSAFFPNLCRFFFFSFTPFYKFYLPKNCPKNSQLCHLKVPRGRRKSEYPSAEYLSSMLSNDVLYPYVPTFYNASFTERDIHEAYWIRTGSDTGCFEIFIELGIVRINFYNSKIENLFVVLQ